VLSEHGCPIAPSTYYDHLARRSSGRHRRDDERKALIEAERAKSRFVRLLGPQDVAAAALAGHDASNG